MFTVEGTIDGQTYEVTVGGTDPDPSTVGVVSGSANAVTLLQLNEGQGVAATPTGPSYTLDLREPATVLAALYDLTHITAVDGDPPQVIPPVDPDVVY